MADDRDTASEETQDRSPERTDGEDNRPTDTLADSKTCPECGAPVDDVRATCINCGYEYSDEDHEDPEAGNEFTSGSQVDDEGNEIPDEEPSNEEPSDEEPSKE